MNGITICFCQTETTRHREDLALCTFYDIFMVSIDTAETDEFIDVTSAVLSDFSDEFGEFAETLMND